MSPYPTITADCKSGKPETRPFSIRLTAAEKRLTGKHAKLRQQNEDEAAAAAARDALDKQALINRQLDERRQLQREIRHARRVHTHDVARLHREISASAKLEQAPDQAGDLEELRVAGWMMRF